VIGGGDIWTEYGVYSCILGPDANSQYHELECQGLAKVTSAFPKFDLRPLHSEVYRTVPQDWKGTLPDHIGGTGSSYSLASVHLHSPLSKNSHYHLVSGYLRAFSPISTDPTYALEVPTRYSPGATQGLAPAPTTSKFTLHKLLTHTCTHHTLFPLGYPEHCPPVTLVTSSLRSLITWGGLRYVRRPALRS
jgi:hypothetical protein